MFCLGFEPGEAEWKVQMNPLSYGCTPYQFYCCLLSVAKSKIVLIIKVKITYAINIGCLNDSGLLSRASEALMAVDVKHPVVSCSAAAVAAAAAASHGFTQIKSDMMYSHHTSSQSIMSSRGNQVQNA